MSLIEQTKSLSRLELVEFNEELVELYREKIGGYPQIISQPKYPNVVFTLEGRIPEGKREAMVIKIDEEDEDGIKAQISSSEIGEHWVNLDYEEEGVHVNSELTEFLTEYFPKTFSLLKDGDIVRLEKDGYRNNGVFLVYGGKIIDLTVEEGFHDYGLVPFELRKYFLNDWQDYGFHHGYPEFDSLEGEKNVAIKERWTEGTYFAPIMMPH